MLIVKKVILLEESELGMEKIESIQNKQVKEWKKLLTRKGRKKQQQYIIEGAHLVEEALKANASLSHILIREDKVAEYDHYISKETVLISTEVADELSDAVTNQGILAILNINESEESLTLKKPLLMLDEVQDPGNVGTLIRSADAAGFEGVIIGKGSVDLYNPKTIRSAQGSHFHLPVIHADLYDWTEKLKQKQIPVYGTALDDRAVSYQMIKTPKNFALIVGNEGNGVHPDLLKMTTKNLYIPIKGEAESLNVAVAGSILMFALYR